MLCSFCKQNESITSRFDIADSGEVTAIEHLCTDCFTELERRREQERREEYDRA